MRFALRPALRPVAVRVLRRPGGSSDARLRPPEDAPDLARALDSCLCDVRAFSDRLRERVGLCRRSGWSSRCGEWIGRRRCEGIGSRCCWLHGHRFGSRGRTFSSGLTIGSLRSGLPCSEGPTRTTSGQFYGPLFGFPAHLSE